VGEQNGGDPPHTFLKNSEEKSSGGGCVRVADADALGFLSLVRLDGDNYRPSSTALEDNMPAIELEKACKESWFQVSLYFIWYSSVLT
jgi:hypothetical protein